MNHNVRGVHIAEPATTMISYRAAFIKFPFSNPHPLPRRFIVYLLFCIVSVQVLINGSFVA